MVVEKTFSVLFLILFAFLSHGADVYWKSDVIQVFNSTRALISNSTFHHFLIASNITITANGMINNDGGAFRLLVRATSVNLYDLIGYSPCFDPSVGELEFLAGIGKTPLNSVSIGRISTTIGNAFTLKAKRYYKTVGSQSSAASFLLIMESHQMQSVHASFVTTGCQPLRTVGYWNDPFQWDGGVVPTSSSHVVLPSKAGVVLLQNDVQVSSLVADGGYIVAHYSGCPAGWSTEPGASTG